MSCYSLRDSENGNIIYKASGQRPEPKSGLKYILPKLLQYIIPNCSGPSELF